MKTIRTIAASALAALVVFGAPMASAQSAEEIKEKLLKQKTRGLVVVPTTQQSTSTATETGVAVANPAYNAVAREDQVNVQISFDFDSAALRDDQKPKLATLCDVMNSIDVAQFQIIGHTDASGSASYNERLSLLRAKEVKRHLVEDCGVPEDRLQAIGMGETAPFDGDDPRADVNRRVEFQALS